MVGSMVDVKVFWWVAFSAVLRVVALAVLWVW